MAYQGNFTGGNILNAADLNEFGNVTILRQNTLSVVNTTNTSPAFNIEDIDVSGWHTGTNNYLTVDLDGVFLLTATARNLNGVTRGITAITQDGNAIADMDTSGGRDLTAVTAVTATSGTQFSMFVWQQSGSTQTPNVSLTCQLVRAT